MAQPMLGRMSIPVKLVKKILLVDHEPRVTRMVRQALERTGHYAIREEHDATFALHAARWFQPDLILVDLNEGAANSESVARQLDADFALRDIPLLCLSDFVSDRGFQSAGILSGYSFFASPVPLEDLLRGVEQLLFGKA